MYFSLDLICFTDFLPPAVVVRVAAASAYLLTAQIELIIRDRSSEVGSAANSTNSDEQMKHTIGT